MLFEMIKIPFEAAWRFIVGVLPGALDFYDTITESIIGDIFMIIGVISFISAGFILSKLTKTKR